MSEEFVTCPFTVLIDTAEGQPFTFQGLRADADKGGLPLYVPTRYSSLGRAPHGLGDYSILGLFGRVAVERKSKEDAWGTILGWETDHQRDRNIPGRRQRFEKELENLSAIECGVVIVEASLDACLADMPEWGAKPRVENQKIFYRSIISFYQRFRVHWIWLPSRRDAEVTAFRWMERYWKKLPKKEREAATAMSASQCVPREEAPF